MLMNKQLIARVTFPAHKDGIDLNIDGTWSNKKVTRLLKDEGIGIEINEPATVTYVRLKDKHIEIHLNGGGYGTFWDSENIFGDDDEGKHPAVKMAGGSRINLRFHRYITADDIDVEKISHWLEPLVDPASLKQDIAKDDIPEEFRDAAENGEIVAGMDKKTVFAIKGEPFDRKLDAEVDPPVEKWQYKIEDLKIMLVTFEGGKVAQVQIF